jgi:hypothetical protein
LPGGNDIQFLKKNDKMFKLIKNYIRKK